MQAHSSVLSETLDSEPLCLLVRDCFQFLAWMDSLKWCHQSLWAQKSNGEYQQDK
jgi:hypothetical protein